jgi:enterochelin esterase-like enzyme
VAGSSFGGLAAAYTALTMPERFGNVLSQSGSYWWWPGYRPDMPLEDVLGPDSGWLATRYRSERRRRNSSG